VTARFASNLIMLSLGGLSVKSGRTIEDLARGED